MESALRCCQCYFFFRKNFSAIGLNWNCENVVLWFILGEFETDSFSVPLFNISMVSDVICNRALVILQKSSCPASNLLLTAEMGRINLLASFSANRYHSMQLGKPRRGGRSGWTPVLRISPSCLCSIVSAASSANRPNKHSRTINERPLPLHLNPHSGC